MCICQLAPNLIIHLKRFGLRGHVVTRDNSAVIVPDVIDLTPFFKDSQASPVHFQLKAIINHSGTLRGGHYTAFGKRGERWLSFNDEKVTEMDPPKDGSPAPYLLFYTRVDLPVPPE
jgi:ubiquitin C-terminal hydrolase